MKHARTILTAVVLALIAFASVTPPAAYAQGRDDRMTQLRKRFQERLPEMQRLRSAGKIGETSVGTVEPVSGSLDKDAQKLVDAENADRAELYQIIARQQGTTAEKVARIDGQRRIKELRPGEYYKDDTGTWKKK